MKNASRLLILMLVFYSSGLGISSAHQAGPITKVTVASGAACEPTCDRAITTSTDFIDVPGASADITVERNSILIARFASDTFCSAKFTIEGMLVPGFCSVVILVSGPGGNFVEMEPVTSGFENFQMDNGTGAQAIERSFGPISPGKYTVKVQFRIFVSPDTAQPGNTFALTAWHLTVEGATAG
jgi:hypothetical protein